jgi:hypothetical protein
MTKFVTDSSKLDLNNILNYKFETNRENND